MTKLAIVSNWDENYEELASLTYPNRKAYAELNGFESFAFHYVGRWGKLPALREAWGEAEWLWWLDADAIITNFSISATSLLPADKDFVIATDLNGINTGSFFIRTTDRMIDLLRDVESVREWIPWSPWHDQTGFAFHLWNYVDHVKLLPQRAMNSYPSGYPYRDTVSERWQPGDFVLHAPFCPHERRLEIFAPLINGDSRG